MKSLTTIKRALLAIIPIVAMGIVSCEKDNPTVSKMPDVVEITCDAGDHPTFTFTVESDWQISSDATWCKFITPAGKVLDMSGKAGSHPITLEITDENIKSEATFANITMKMDGKTAIIAKIERGAKKLYMRIYDSSENEIDAIEIGYVEWISFSVEANFRFAAVSYPDWVEFYGGAVTGAPGEITEAKARILPNGEREKYPITKDDNLSITFSDESGDNTFTFPIIFKGMSSYDLTFEGPTTNTFGWEVSLDGKQYRQASDSVDESTTFDRELQFNITARENDYEILLFEKVVDRGIPSYELGAEWMAFNKEDMTLTVAATDNTRYGMVMALPRGLYNDIRSDIKGAIFELDYTTGIGLETVMYDFLKYIIIEFTQTDFSARDPYDGMYVYHSLTTYEIPCSVYTDTTIIEKYGVEEAFTCPFPTPRDGKTPSIIIDPRIEQWTTDTFTEGRATVEFYYRDNRLKASDGEYEVGENKNEVMATQLFGPKDGFEEEVYAVFKLDGVAKKLLVVTPPTK